METVFADFDYILVSEDINSTYRNKKRKIKIKNKANSYVSGWKSQYKSCKKNNSCWLINTFEQSCVKSSNINGSTFEWGNEFNGHTLTAIVNVVQGGGRYNWI